MYSKIWLHWSGVGVGVGFVPHADVDRAKDDTVAKSSRPVKMGRKIVKYLPFMF